MTPEEKALKLVHDMYFAYGEVSMAQAKQCALIAVDEIIRIAPWGGDIDGEIEEDSKEYYMEVKEEIKKL